MWKGSHGAKGKNACLRSHAQARMHSGVAALSYGDPVGPPGTQFGFREKPFRMRKATKKG